MVNKHCNDEGNINGVWIFALLLLFFVVVVLPLKFRVNSFIDELDLVFFFDIIFISFNISYYYYYPDRVEI